jgi:hypothetical protein
MLSLVKESKRIDLNIFKERERSKGAREEYTKEGKEAYVQLSHDRVVGMLQAGAMSVIYP